MIKLIAPYELPGTEQGTLEECISFCKSLSVICVDTETRPKQEFKRYPKAGLDPYMSDIVMLQVGNQDVQWIIDARSVNIKDSALIDILSDSSIKKLLVNAKFDYKMLFTNYGVRLNNIHDLMVQEMLLYTGISNKGYSLEKMVNRYLNIKFRENVQLDLFGKNNLEGEIIVSKDVRKEFFHLDDKPFTYNQVYYGAKDVELPALIYPLQCMLLKNEKFDQQLIDQENEFTLVLGDIELNGIGIDTAKWVDLYKQNLIKRDEAIRKLNSTVENDWMLQKFVTSSLFGDEKNVQLNWSSSQQVAKLFKQIGVPVSVLDKKKSKGQETEFFKDSVEEMLLSKYRDKYPIINDYLTYRRYFKAANTYGEEFLANLHPVTGRIHSSYRQILKTGRVGSNNPNLQNIPAGEKIKGFRECIVPFKGNKFVIADYSSQELRILAEYSDEQIMIDLLNSGGDLHSLTASKVFSLIRGEDVIVSKTVNSDLRQRGKILNFGIAYGMSAYKLSNDFGTSLEEAAGIIEAFYAVYPNLNQYFNWRKEAVLSTGVIIIDPFLNRKSYLFDYWKPYMVSKAIIEAYRTNNPTGAINSLPKAVKSSYFVNKGVLERAAQNYPIQGTGASMTKLACCLLRQHQVKTSNFGLFSIVNVIHDEIMLECPEENASEINELLKSTMTKAGSFFCKKVNTVVEGVVTDYWNH